MSRGVYMGFPGTKNTRERQPERKRMQFSQRMTLISAVFSMAVVAAALTANFVLLWCGKEPMPQETITTITVYGGITSTLTLGGYLAISGVRDCSLNKHVYGKQTDQEEDEST